MQTYIIDIFNEFENQHFSSRKIDSYGILIFVKLMTN